MKTLSTPLDFSRGKFVQLSPSIHLYVEDAKSLLLVSDKTEEEWKSDLIPKEVPSDDEQACFDSKILECYANLVGQLGVLI